MAALDTGKAEEELKDIEMQENKDKGKRRLSMTAMIEEKDLNKKKGKQGDEGEAAKKQLEEKDKKGKEKKKELAKKKTEADFRTGQRRLLVLMLKQVLRSAQINRELVSINCHTIVLLANSPECLQMKLQMVAFSKAIVEKQQQPLGPPHLYCFAGLLKAMISRGVEVGKKNNEGLKEAQEMFDKASLSDRQAICQMCKVEKMYKNENKRLVMSFGSADLARLITDSLVQTGAEQKYGKAPPSYLERELQDYLECFEM